MNSNKVLLKSAGITEEDLAYHRRHHLPVYVTWSKKPQPGMVDDQPYTNWVEYGTQLVPAEEMLKAGRGKGFVLCTRNRHSKEAEGMLRRRRLTTRRWVSLVGGPRLRGS